MKSNLFKLLAILAIPTLIVFVACDEEEETTIDPNDTAAAIDDSYAEKTVSRVINTVNYYGLNEEEIKSPMIGCVEVTTDTTDWPKTMTIDFTNCDSDNRSGKIIAEFSGTWGEDIVAGTSVSITFENFVNIEGTSISGNVTGTYEGVNAQGGPTYGYVATDVVIIDAADERIEWNTNRTIQWIEGYDDPSVDLLDNNIYLVHGTNSGVNRNGNAYTSEVNENNPLRVDYNCTEYQITEGVLEVQPENISNPITVNFGDGTCDTEIAVTYLGITTTVPVGQ